MPLTGLSAEEIEELENQMLQGVPLDGSSIGNKRLREEILNWDSEKYFAVRIRLIDEGEIITGRGKGGSVRRTSKDARGGLDGTEIDAPAGDGIDPYPTEESLYSPVTEVIRNRWTQDQRFDQALVELTARGGRRKDGVWTRPDITVAAKTSYTYVPGPHFDVISFEIKHYTGLDVTAVYEALAHRRAASRSYVLVYVPDDQIHIYESPILEDLSEEASKHGIGLIVVSDPSDPDTWEVHEEAERVIPDPSRLDSFIKNQISEGSREQISRWFRY